MFDIFRFSYYKLLVKSLWQVKVVIYSGHLISQIKLTTLKWYINVEIYPLHLHINKKSLQLAG